jgi:hypothetical protein
MSNFLSFLAYAWRIFVNLIVLAVVLGIFSGLHARFETVVVAILGLLYVSIRSIAFSQTVMLREAIIGIDHHFVRIRDLLGDERILEHQVEMDQLKEAGDRRINRAYVDLFFLGIVSLVCIYHLLSG